MPKLTKEKTDEIVRLLGEGYTNLEVSRKAQVSEGTVSRIKVRLRKGWEEVVKSEALGETSAPLGALLSGGVSEKVGGHPGGPRLWYAG